MGSLTLHELLATLRAHGVREVVLRLDPAGLEAAPPAPPMVLAPPAPAAAAAPAPEAPRGDQGDVDEGEGDEGPGDDDPLFWATELRPRKRKGPDDEG